MFYLIFRASSVIIILSLSLFACGQINSNETDSSVSEETARSSSDIERVVALTSLSADIIYHLDSTKLVGIPGSRLLREDERFVNLPQMNEGQSQPDLEKIISLEPDLVIGAAGFSDRALDKLDELGIETIATEINSWESLRETTKTLASAIGANPEALLANYESYLPDNEETDKQISTLVLVSRQPILAPNKNSWAGDLLSHFPISNVAADLQGSSPVGGYITLSPEKILQSDPEVIIIVDPAQEGILEQLEGESFWQNLQATQSNQVYAFDYYGLVNPGSLTKIEAVSEKLKTTFD